MAVKLSADGLGVCEKCGGVVDLHHDAYCRHCGNELPSLYDEAAEAGDATSSSGRFPVDTSPRARARLIGSFRDPQSAPSKGGVIQQLGDAERTMARAKADLDNADYELADAMAEFPDFDRSDVSALTPAARTRYLRITAAIPVQRSAQEAYQRARQQVDRLSDEYQQMVDRARHPEDYLPPEDPLLIIRGNRSLY
jgi:hypothetical protein